MLIPLYAITPAYYMFLKKVRQPVLFTFGLVIGIVLSSVHVPIADVAIAKYQACGSSSAAILHWLYACADGKRAKNI